MTLIPVDNLDDVARRRDRMLARAEQDVADAVADATRRFLARMQQRIRQSLTAAVTASPGLPFATSSLFTLGELSGWWQDEVDSTVVDAVRRAWTLGHFDTSDAPLTTSSLGSAGEYLANVTDRLSRTATPTLPEQAFDRVRVAIADEVGRGATVRQMTERLGAELDWQGGPARVWEARRDAITDQLERRLDQYGPPTFPDPNDPTRNIENRARTDARMNDPEIAALQAQRTEYVKMLDADRSTWEVRAERIARTETTGAYNAGALDAGHAEGQRVKVWVATGDDRTRDSHLAASGTCVGIDDPFDVGGAALEMPGDPSGPPEETINCRCTIVFAESCEAAGKLVERAEQTIDVEREARRQDAADLDPTEVPLSTFGVGDDTVIDTRSINGQMDGGRFVYSDERIAEVHDRYIADQLANGIRVDEPTATFMGGGPASGKSSIIDSGNVNLPRGHVTVDPDQAKAAIPEYRAGTRAGDVRAASFAHEESSDMAKRLMRESLDEGYNTVVDGTGDGSFDGLTAKIAAAREHGASRIVGEYVTVDTDEAVRRAMARAEQTGRMVPEEVIRGTHAAVSDVFPKASAANLFDELRLYDTNAGAPRLIYQKVGGVEEILDPEAWASFLAKADG